MESKDTFVWDGFIHQLTCEGTRLTLHCKSLDFQPIYSSKSNNADPLYIDGGIVEQLSAKNDSSNSSRKRKKAQYNFSSSDSEIEEENAGNGNGFTKDGDSSNVTKIGSKLDNNLNSCYYDFEKETEICILNTSVVFNPICFDYVPFCIVKFLKKIHLNKGKGKKQRHSQSKKGSSFDGGLAILRLVKPNKEYTSKDYHKNNDFAFELLKIHAVSGIDDLLGIENDDYHKLTFFVTYLVFGFIQRKSCSLDVFAECSNDKDINRQTFCFDVCKNRKETASDLNILHYFFIPETLAFVIILKINKQMRAFLFQPVNKVDHSLCAKETNKVKHEMIPIQMSTLIPADLADIILQVHMISLSVDQTQEGIHSSLVVVTNSGFALFFTDGVLDICVSLISESSPLLLCEPSSLEEKQIEILHFDSSSPCTAVLINSQCFLIDWIHEKVIKVWKSTSKIMKSICHTTGCLKLILLFQNKDSDGSSYKNMLDAVDWEMYDVESHGQHSSSNERVRSIDASGDQSNQSGEPICAVNALKAQQKICASAIREAEVSLHLKDKFISETWEHLSKLQLGDSSADHQNNNSKLPPLLCVVEGSQSGCPSSPVPSKMSPLEATQMWSKIVGSDIVVGVDVKNVSDRPIFGVSLDLACASHSQPAIFTSTCTRLHIPNNYTESENLAQLHFQIKPSCTATLTSHTDITHAMSAQDVRLFAFVSYDKKLEKSCNSLQQQERKIDIFIGEVNLANMDLLKKADIGCINDDSECEVSLQEIQTLDCLQYCTDLDLHSLVTSCLCVSRMAQSHTSLTYIPWANQFLYTEDTPLRHCRLKILEQTGKFQGHIQIFARSEHLALLFVKFLISFLPGDVRIVPPVFRLSQSLQQAALSLAEHVNSAVSLTSDKLKSVKETKLKQTLHMQTGEDVFEVPKPVENQVEQLCEVSCVSAVDIDKGNVKKARKRLREKLKYQENKDSS